MLACLSVDSSIGVLIKTVRPFSTYTQCQVGKESQSCCLEFGNVVVYAS